MSDYQKIVRIQASPEAIYEALTKGIPKWWGEVDQSAEDLGDQFRVSFGEAFWGFKITAIASKKTLTWLCVESNQVHAGLQGVKEEWLGTKLHWEITPIDSYQSEVKFLHEGLTSAFNCYEVCTTAWDFFIGDSLKAYLEKGIGQPA